MSSRSRLSRRKVAAPAAERIAEDDGDLVGEREAHLLLEEAAAAAPRAPPVSGGGSTRMPKSCAARSGGSAESGRKTARQRL